MGLYLEVIEMRSLRWILIQSEWCPYKKRLGHRHSQRDAHVRTQGKDHVCMSESEASEEPHPANTVLSDSQPPELWENKCLLFKPPMLECFALATLANEYTIT